MYPHRTAPPSIQHAHRSSVRLPPIFKLLGIKTARVRAGARPCGSAAGERRTTFGETQLWIARRTPIPSFHRPRTRTSAHFPLALGRPSLDSFTAAVEMEGQRQRNPSERGRAAEAQVADELAASAARAAKKRKAVSLRQGGAPPPPAKPKSPAKVRAASTSAVLSAPREMAGTPKSGTGKGAGAGAGKGKGKGKGTRAES